MIGHVETTIVAAQIKAGRKGLTTQKLAAMRRLITMIASIVRVRSGDGTLVFIMLWKFLFVY
jgi:hypothetical protein